jgi:hypothetical protein
MRMPALLWLDSDCAADASRDDEYGFRAAFDIMGAVTE